MNKNKRLLIILIISQVASFFQLYSQNQTSNYYLKGNKLLENSFNQKSILEKAILEYNKCIQLSKNDYECYAMRGIAYHQLGRFTEAIKNFNLSINEIRRQESNTDYQLLQIKKIQFYKCAALIETKKTDSIITLLKDIYSSLPEIPRANLYLEFYGLKIEKETIGKLTKFLETELTKEFKNKYINIFLGYLKAFLNKNSESLNHFREENEKLNKFEKYYINLGILAKRIEDYNESIEYYTKAAEINNLNSNTFFELGNLYYQKSDIDNSLINYQTSWAIDSPYVVALKIGTIYLESNNYSQTEYWCDETLKINWLEHYSRTDGFSFDNSIGLYTLRALAKEGNMDFEGAIQDYSFILNLKQGYQIKKYNAYLARGKLKIKMKDYRGAIADFNKIIENRYKENLTQALFNRAISKSELKDYKEALEDYTNVIKLDNQFPEAYYNRAMLYFEIGTEKNKACLDLSRAGELGIKEAYEAIKTLCN